MTKNQLRDRLAELTGWKLIGGKYWMPAGPASLRVGQKRHPIPTTLDGIAALWNEHAKGWRWAKMPGVWVAWKNAPKNIDVRRANVPATGDEWTDRATLLMKVMVA